VATTPRTASVSGGALEKAGLVTIAMRGRERVYQLETERLRSVAGGWLGRFG
jgi:DNA-binding transcriptional ArsR family regulator